MLVRSPTRAIFGRRALLVLVVLFLMAISVPAVSPIFAVVASTVTWGQAQNASNTAARALFPSLAIDSNGRSHILFNVVSEGKGSLWYTNNVSGSFAPAQQVVGEEFGTNSEPFFTITVGPNNSLHISYSRAGRERGDGQVYYQQGTLNGASATWAAPQRVSDSPAGTKSFGVFLDVDNGGNAHIVWIDNRCGQIYNVFHRVRQASGALGGVSPVDSNCGVGQDRPQIAITNDGKPHVSYQRGNEIYYARLEATGWQRQNMSNSPSLNSTNGTITTDGTNPYVAWGEGISSGNHDIQFRRSTDGGQTWSNVVDFSNNGNAFGQFPSITYSASTQRIYVAWTDNINSPDGKNDIWAREFDPASGDSSEARRLATLSNDSTLPSASAGPGVAAVAWQDRTTGDWQTFYVSGTTAGGGGGGPTPPPTGCTGSLTLEGGAKATKKTTLSGTVTPSGCTPTQMQVTIDTKPDANTPKVAYNANISIPAPQSNVCDRKVYVQLFDATGRTGTPAEASIQIDTAVTAAVQAMNPHASSLPGSYTPPKSEGMITNDDVSTAGASDGAAMYTRDRVFFLNVSGNGECSGLRAFSIAGSISGQITTNNFASALPLPGDASIGPKEFNVVISDTADNMGMFPSQSAKFKMIYDPPDTDASIGVTNTLGLPVLSQGGSVAASAENSVFRTLTFNGINVSDNLYGPSEDLPPGRQFWGIWIANSRQDNDQNNPNLDWTPVRVATPNTSFTVQWNLFSGLNYGGDATKTGDYFVYIRFLDGAGNPSADLLKVRATLQPGYSIPKVHLPLVRR